MVGTCLEKCNKVSTVTHRVKGQSTKLPVLCPEIMEDYNSNIGGVELLNQRTACKLDCKSSGRRYYFTEFFDLMEILCCKFPCNLQIIVPKRNGITRFQNCSG